MIVRGIYVSDDSAVLIFAEKSYTMCIFSEIIHKCPLRMIMHKSGPMEGLSVATVASKKNPQMFLLNFQ
jgi:hypothetical protein